MSVINQVLSRLERRGINIEPEQELVRAVPPHRPARRRHLILLMLALLAGGAWWWQARGVHGSGAQRIVPPVAATGVPAVSPAVPAVSSVARVLPDKPLREAPAPVVMSGKVAATAAASVPAAAAVQAASAPRVVARPVPPPPGVVTPKPVAVAEVRNKVADKPARVPVAPSANRVAPSKPEIRQENRPRGAPSSSVALGGMPMKQVSRAQQAEAEFRKGIDLMQQGREADAIGRYRAALELDGTHDGARQALVALLLEGKQRDEAERLLQTRLEEKPEHTGFAMLLARLQVERGAAGEAQVTLERSLAYAETKADYLAFLAALQQRNNFHAEAVSHYQAALKLQPGNGAWLMGYGISLQALRRNEEAKAAYRQALDSKTLGPDLETFVQRKLKAL